MKYYVVSDVHGYFTPMKKALEGRGFFDDKEPHKLIVCGDMMDRGEEACEMQDFMLDLHNRGELIFVRGNHEDLLIEMLAEFEKYRWDISFGTSHHNSNGTWDTALQLSGMSDISALQSANEFIKRVVASHFCSTLLPSSVNFFETPNYIFVHGHIPCFCDNKPAWYQMNRWYRFNPEWRTASAKDWDIARWRNGMELGEAYDIAEPGKKIVCGHWHASYGHSNFDGTCSEFGDDADFTPFYGENVIAIDACTAHSGFVNCVVIED